MVESDKINIVNSKSDCKNKINKKSLSKTLNKVIIFLISNAKKVFI